MFVTFSRMAILRIGARPVIHRMILSGLLYFPSRAAGHVYIPELLYFCLFSEVVRAGVRLVVSLCPGHVVVGQPHCTLVGRAPVHRHQTVVTVALRVAFGWSLEAIFLGCQDISPSFIEQIMISLKLLLLLFQAPCSCY